ncbi:hypothetical protein ACJ73_09384 [Blastomyces percursus]|uniref:HNH nuclease domain-containing protein n=1 Tax=Blastomyces percursus TaxID=1658174 RepID=A0A1J9QAS0_9EURO|nr:hypothetical protein ACJ73_09384 [Blastomyces percursus]
MTLLGAVHTTFGKFQIAFEPVDEAHTYRLQLYRFPTFLQFHLPEPDENNERVVRFTNNANDDLPSRVLLSAHAAVAGILHATGMARTIDQIFRDREELPCLAADGCTNIWQLPLLAR